ncbi:AAA family ATPase [Micromonospora sp. NPDC127501]|uniref:AAA family ATPase n=1 Tax=Micromonospora sp. NPDC127501 TaxID=3154872 RepID=UPI003318D7C8
MRITRISVINFLGLAAAEVCTDRPLTVVTGANGSGKSTLLQALSLVVDAVQASLNGTLPLDSEWWTAGHKGAESFEVRVGVRFDALDERRLIDAYYRAAILHLLHPEATDVIALSSAVDGQSTPESASPMMVGDLVVIFDQRQRGPWTVGWEFALPRGPVNVQLLGNEMGRLLDGPVAAGPTSLQYLSELCPSTNDIVEKVDDGRVPVDLWKYVPDRRIEFVVEQVNAPVQPPSVAAVSADPEYRSQPQARVPFAHILELLIRRRLQVTDNHRAPMRTRFGAQELAWTPSLRDGSLLALELHRLKNGSAGDRRRFATVQASFRQLTGEQVDCTERVMPDDNGNTEVILVPAIQIEVGNDGHDVPLHRAGAGAAEALLLATLLADERRCVFLDEPAVHLSPTAQRQLLSMLRGRRSGPGQALWVTHNPDLVPAQAADDLTSIVRMARDTGRTVNSLVANSRVDVATVIRLLASAEVRSLLFAAGVVLFEGPTDLAAVGRWLDRSVTGVRGPLPTPDERNLTFLSVDGQNGFGALASLANQLGVPWVIVADGPALRPGSIMAKQLAKLGKAVPQSGEKLTDVRAQWAAEGVFSLADDFGDDGSKAGEIEAFLSRLDAQTLARVRKDVGTLKGVRVGAAFADAVSAPQEVVALWADILLTFDLPRT